MTRLGMAMGGRMDLMGLAGVGDLFATAVSKLSRNYRVGRALGEGRTLADALAKSTKLRKALRPSESVMVLARRHGCRCLCSRRSRTSCAVA